MKKIILPILILCCMIAACSTMEPPAPSAGVQTQAKVQGAVSVSPAMVPTPLPVKAQLAVPEVYNEKSIFPMAGSGVFLLCTDSVEMKQGSHYDAYTVDEDGQLTRLEDHLFNNAFVLDGSRYHLTLDWAEHDGSAVCTYIPADSPACIMSLSGNVNETLFLLRDRLSQDGSTVYTNYPVLVDLESGELTDFLANCKLNNIPNICSAAFSPDRKGLLLAQEGGALYYCDLGSSVVYSLDELSSEPVKACAIADGRIICWNQGSSDRAGGNVGDYHFWYIDMEDFHRQELPQLESDVDTDLLRFAHLSGFDGCLYEGKIFAGSTFALCTSGSGQTYVLDMAAWSLSPVEAYTLPVSNVSCTGSFDGQRLLLQDTGNNKAYVLDYSSCRMFSLSVQSAGNLMWFDNDTVLEHAKDGNYYLYDLNL